MSDYYDARAPEVVEPAHRGPLPGSDRRLSPPGVKPEYWQVRRPGETCAICSERPPVWLVLDPKEHVHYKVVQRKGESHLSTERLSEGYLVCNSCRSQIERYNVKRPRKITFIKWSVDADPTPPKP